MNPFDLVGKEFRTLSIRPNIYAQAQSHDIQNQYFYGYYDISDNDILAKVSAVTFN